MDSKSTIMTSTKKISEIVTNYLTMLTTTTSNDNKGVAKQAFQNNSMSMSVIVGISIASFITLIILIYAIYKYRNRDEGTYTIDETKNFGPFADLDANNFDTNIDEKTSSLNCGLKKAKGAKKESFNRNKEWYV